MTMAYNFDVDERGPLQDTMYFSCPSCGLVSSPTSVSYALTADRLLDPQHPVEATCSPGQHKAAVAVDDFLVRDTEVTCVRRPDPLRPDGCQATFAVPARADQVCCPSCGLYQRGPAAKADPARADAVRRAEHAFGQYAAAVVGGFRRGGSHDDTARSQ